MKMKKSFLFIVILALGLIVSACGGSAADSGGASGPFKVAVIMPSTINDLAFSQSMYDALLAVQTEMGGEEAFEIVYSENMFVVDDAAAAIRDYATEGYNLVVAHGSQYGSSLQEIAPGFPNDCFCLGHYTQHL
jgi:basic membrane lipoprotein Med (substrate-binding protein (PBP1-ABC) superfamily)